MSACEPLLNTSVRVLTWNLWWRFGPWRERQAAIRATIAALDPDICGFQEVWDDDEANQVGEMADELGYDWAFAHRPRLETWEGDGADAEVRFGNAIMSRWPIARRAQLPLPAGEDADEGRTVLFGEIDGPRGPIPFFTTHLNYRFDHAHVRLQQAETIARFVDAQRPWAYPPIVTGDFNAQPESDEIRSLTGFRAALVKGIVFRDAWRYAGNDTPGNTWDVERNPFAAETLEHSCRLDYVLVGWPRGARGAGHVLSCRLVGDEPVNGVLASDHFGVVAELRY